MTSSPSPTGKNIKGDGVTLDPESGRRLGHHSPYILSTDDRTARPLNSKSRHALGAGDHFLALSDPVASQPTGKDDGLSSRVRGPGPKPTLTPDPRPAKVRGSRSRPAIEWLPPDWRGPSLATLDPATGSWTTAAVVGYPTALLHSLDLY